MKMLQFVLAAFHVYTSWLFYMRFSCLCDSCQMGIFVLFVNFSGKMSALRLNIVKNITKSILNGQYCSQVRFKSSKILTTAIGSLSNVEKIVVTADNSTFIAWHPTSDFPYEYSKPLPPPAIPTSTLLKDDAIQTAMKAFGNKKPELAQQELMKLTNTSFHTWKPRPRDRKAKKTKPDREYL